MYKRIDDLLCNKVFKYFKVFYAITLYYNKLRENLYEGRRIICTKE